MYVQYSIVQWSLSSRSTPDSGTQAVGCCWTSKLWAW